MYWAAQATALKSIALKDGAFGTVSGTDPNLKITLKKAGSFNRYPDPIKSRHQRGFSRRNRGGVAQFDLYKTCHRLQKDAKQGGDICKGSGQ